MTLTRPEATRLFRRLGDVTAEGERGPWANTDPAAAAAATAATAAATAAGNFFTRQGVNVPHAAAAAATAAATAAAAPAAANPASTATAASAAAGNMPNMVHVPTCLSEAGRCRLTVSKLDLKARLVSELEPKM